MGETRRETQKDRDKETGTERELLSKRNELSYSLKRATGRFVRRKGKRKLNREKRRPGGKQAGQQPRSFFTAQVLLPSRLKHQKG